MGVIEGNNIVNTCKIGLFLLFMGLYLRKVNGFYIFVSMKNIRMKK